MALTFGSAGFRVIRGLTWADTVTVKDDEGNPVDLTDAEFLMQIRESIDADEVIMELSSGANGRLEAPTPTNGQINILVSADDTLDFPLNDYLKSKYVYDFIILRGTGDTQVREPVIGGKVTVKSKVSR